MVNNCINDKRRVFGTIIGIAGCTALIVTAVTVDNNIQKSFTWQYEDVYNYDTVIRYNAGVEGAQAGIQEVLDSGIDLQADVAVESKIVRNLEIEV